jgi:hypothetical protein
MEWKLYKTSNLYSEPEPGPEPDEKQSFLFPGINLFFINTLLPALSRGLQ